jgi:hypothetical protein
VTGLLLAENDDVPFRGRLFGAAALTPHPEALFMRQIVRTLTMRKRVS